MINVHITFTNDNPNTLFNRLAAKLGRAPTNAECREAILELVFVTKRKSVTKSSKAAPAVAKGTP